MCKFEIQPDDHEYKSFNALAWSYLKYDLYLNKVNGRAFYYMDNSLFIPTYTVNGDRICFKHQFGDKTFWLPISNLSPFLKRVYDHIFGLDLLAQALSKGWMWKTWVGPFNAENPDCPPEFYITPESNID
jgi:hypothetical protein